MEAQYAALKRILQEIGPCLVAFSGGVDSTLLVKVARDVLGDGATAITAVSPSLAVAERREAEFLADLIGIRHRFVETREMDDPRYVRNDGARCYYCKSELFRVLEVLAAEAGGRALVYGAILDDLGDDRPGLRAAAEAGARAPLVEAGLTKEMVRAISRSLRLPTWDKPAMACLASRIPRSVSVTREVLGRVERAEAAIRALGYRQVRVRVHGEGARVELDGDGLARSARPSEGLRVIEAVLAAGFGAAVIDPLGYRTGGRSAPQAAPRI
ncbi:MAG: TIGR00268 family protein [Acidobacteria bacterium 13_1_40CM_2_68_10]|nr:MAG: TIGR00268 family protein [Acidobacteria bacterium 13_1_40CM_2_68_10]OLE65201.1 MAG: TIGR00268 family protein [Acidobacteria bacterium 13_1_20CM_2_68_14]